MVACVLVYLRKSPHICIFKTLFKETFPYFWNVRLFYNRFCIMYKSYKLMYWCNYLNGVTDTFTWSVVFIVQLKWIHIENIFNCFCYLYTLHSKMVFKVNYFWWFNLRCVCLLVCLLCFLQLNKRIHTHWWFLFSIGWFHCDVNWIELGGKNNS